MDEDVGREQVFQLGVNYVKNHIETVISPAFLHTTWDGRAKNELIDHFKLFYNELKSKMPFLKEIEYPRVSFYVEGSSLKIDVQGWLHFCHKCTFLGSRWFNKNVFYDLYLCENHRNHKGAHYIIRYGDHFEDEYYKFISSKSNLYGTKWLMAQELHNNLGDLLIISPKILMEGE